MAESAAALFGSLPIAWLIGAVGAVLILLTMAESRRIKREAARLVTAQEVVADGVWEVKAAGEARRRAETATEAKSRFLATVSHEVRTPLNGILGMAELLGSTPLDAEQQAYVDAIHSSGRALSALIGEVLDLSRIEAGRLDLAADPFDVATLVEAVVELLAPQAQEKGLELAAFVAPDLPARVVGDAARLRQVLINLAGNAVKFTERGGVGVKVEGSATGALRFTVSDTGPGVPQDRRAAIFDEFEQGASAGRSGSGSGLGLSIARRLVRLMGGEIALADRPDGGSVFSFEAHLPSAGGEPRPALAGLAGMTALVVARSPFQAPYLAQMLGAAGARVAIVASADEALAALGSSCDLMLIDCGLGEADMQRLADSARVRAVPRRLLMFSPFERRAFGGQLVTAFGGWLVKPVRASSLQARIGGGARATSPVVLLPLPPAAPPVRPGFRVLLAEDNEINTLVMRKMLDRIGADVTYAADGAVALQEALGAMRGEARRFDLILMDIAMPGLDGQEAARLIRRAEQGRGAAPTRIVALTAYAFDEDRQACFDAGIDDFLTKPVDFQRLCAALEPDPPAAREAEEREALSAA